MVFSVRPVSDDHPPSQIRTGRYLLLIAVLLAVAALLNGCVVAPPYRGYGHGYRDGYHHHGPSHYNQHYNQNYRDDGYRGRGYGHRRHGDD
jgi:hypothetical protein